MTVTHFNMTDSSFCIFLSIFMVLITIESTNCFLSFDDFSVVPTILQAISSLISILVVCDDKQYPAEAGACTNKEKSNLKVA